MERKPDIYQALRVYQKIINFGLKQSNSFDLNGLKANAGSRENSITIKDEQVSLDIYFHNRYQLHYEDVDSLGSFLDKLNKVDQKQYS